MPVYRGRRPKTQRVVLWVRGTNHEWVVPGTRKEALAFEARKRVELDNHHQVELRVAPRFSDFCVNHYRPWAETHLGANTWRKVRVYQVDTLSKGLGHLRLSEFSSSAIDEYKRDRLESIGASSVNNELRVLKTMLRWGREERGLPIPDFRIRMLPTGERRVRVWSLLEVHRMLAAAREHAPPLVPILVFMVNTGLRKGEVIAADWSWVDRRARLLRIPVTAQWRPKSKKPREVPLSDAVLELLEALPTRDGALFLNRRGDRFACFPEDPYDKVQAAAEVEGGPHTTRHTFASLFLQKKPDLFALSKILGHSHTKTTELYSHLLPGHLQSVRNLVNLREKPGKTMAATMARRSK